MKLLKIQLLFVIFILQSCNCEKKYISTELSSHYELKDTSKLKAINFLLENIHYQHSDIPLFIYKDNFDIFDINLENIKDESSLKNLMIKYNLYSSYETEYDTSFINNDLIIENVDMAFDTWNKYSWAKNVPENIFHNYLLPYKIYGEKPDLWRNYFHEMYADSITLMFKGAKIDTDSFFNAVIKEKVEKWYPYNLSTLKLTRYSGLEEMKIMKSGDCGNCAYINAYVMRTFGIPATIDIIPLWGARNGGHNTEVFWDEKKQAFKAPPGRLLYPSFPAKVFRLTFKPHHLWTDSIKPFVHNTLFLLEYLKHDHWIDVTEEHVKTVDIEYILPEATNQKYAYICVFNHGKWKPIYWSTINDGGKAIFRNMGNGILYRIAIPDNGNYKLISNIIRVDTLCHISSNLPNIKSTTKLTLSRFNKNNDAIIKSGKSYNLYYWSEENLWNLHGTEICGSDTIITFDNVPYNTYYRLTRVDGSETLERIFTYDNGKQKWW